MRAHPKARDWRRANVNRAGEDIDLTLDRYAAHVLRGLANRVHVITREGLLAEAERLEHGE
jgi:hypothetical protein